MRVNRRVRVILTAALCSWVALLSVLHEPAFAGTITATWNGSVGSGAWEIRPYWFYSVPSSDPYPDNDTGVDTFDVVIDGQTFSPSMVFLSTPVSIDTLSVSFGDGLFLNDGSSLTLNGDLNNDGYVMLNGTSSMTTLELGGDIAFNGSGIVTLNGSDFNRIHSSSSTLTNTASHTIAGAGVIDNTYVVNAGLIDANIAGEHLSIWGGVSANTGVLQASNGGTLEIYAEGVGGLGGGVGGTIQALDGSTVLLDGGTWLEGGVLSTQGTGLIRNSNGSVRLTDMTVDGMLELTRPYFEGGVLAGSLTNNGSITLGNDGSASTRLYLEDTGGLGTVTLDGTGTLRLEGLSTGDLDIAIDTVILSNGATLVNTASHTIEGAGHFEQASVENHGLIDANIAGGTLELGSGSDVWGVTTNTGTLQASNGGTLEFTGLGDGLVGMGGTVQALDGSTVLLNGGTWLEGGVLSTQGTGLIRNSNGSVQLTDMTVDGMLELTNPYFEGGVLNGTLTNNGSITLGNDGLLNTSVLLDAGGSGTMTFDGTGTLRLDAVATGVPGGDQVIDGNSTTLVNAASHTIEGAGRIENASLQNAGLIDANLTGLTLYAGNVSANTGILQASNGGILELSGLDIADGTLQALDGSSVLLTGSSQLSGGVLDAQGSGLVTNIAGFTQNGGTVSGILQNQGSFTYNGGTFSGRLLNQGALSLGADFTAGDGLEHLSSHTVAAGETLTLNGSGLDNQGDLDVDGVLQGDGPLVNYAQLGGSGEIGGTGGFTNYGLFAPGSGFEISNTGANANYGNMDVATGGQLRVTDGSLVNHGTLNLNSGSVLGTGAITNSYGGTVSGRGNVLTGFDNAGGVLLVESGTTYVAQDFSNSGLIQLTSYSANLGGGVITSSGGIEGYGHIGNDIGNTGSIEALGGTLTLSGSVVNSAGGLLTASSGNKLVATAGLLANDGVLNLNGGTFDNNGHAFSSTGQISGHGNLRTGGLTNAGSITLTGGNSTVTGDVTNQVGHQIEIAQDAALFTGDIVNEGVFKTTNTTVSFAGSYTENGGFISDPSDNYFTDITLGTTGYWVGGEGDRFFVSGDLLSSSEVSVLWNTTDAELIFQAGTDSSHDLQYTGEDRGQSASGYADNFAWGALSVEAGQSLTLLDGDAVPGGAIYTHLLELADGLAQISSIVSNGINIYYDPNLAGNDYLGGETFALTGGGSLAPVPEPYTGVLLALGLTGLALVGSRKREKTA